MWSSSVMPFATLMVTVVPSLWTAGTWEPDFPSCGPSFAAVYTPSDSSFASLTQIVEYGEYENAVGGGSSQAVNVDGGVPHLRDRNLEPETAQLELSDHSSPQTLPQNASFHVVEVMRSRIDRFRPLFRRAPRETCSLDGKPPCPCCT